MPNGQRVLFASAEVAPFAKAGGLADVAGSLPKALAALGADIRVVTPLYASIDREQYGLKTIVDELPVPLDGRTEMARVWAGRLSGKVPLYLVDLPRYFQRENIYGEPDDGERFIAFSRAALELTRALRWQPDLVHTNDWHTAVIPNWLRTIYRNDPVLGRTASYFSIHNLAYQGIFAPSILDLANLSPYGLLFPETRWFSNLVDLMARGIIFGDLVGTVSEQYAREILTPEFGERLDPILRDRREDLVGILNGIDYDEFDPTSDPHLKTRFDAQSLDRRVLNKLSLQSEVHLTQDPQIPLIGMITRLVDQKGFDLLSQVVAPLIEQAGVQLVLLGTGEARYLELFAGLPERYPGRVATIFRFDAALAQRIYGGSDLFLMPSRYEPCGIGQLVSMRYGSVPVVRAVGGLADTVTDFDPASGQGTGFTFEAYDPWALYGAVIRAIEAFRNPSIWRAIQTNGMAQDFSWDRSARRYLDVYRRAVEQRATLGTTRS